MSLGAGARLWTLVDALHVGDPNQARISRLGANSCADTQMLENPPGPAAAERYRAEAMAVDGDTIYLYLPGTGIVTHEFAPTFTCP